MSSRRLLPYKDAIVNLYKHVGNEPFYTQDVAHIFPAQRINIQNGCIMDTSTTRPNNPFFNWWNHTLSPFHSIYLPSGVSLSLKKLRYSW